MSESIDWAYWQKLPEVKVFEAIALLNGTEPESEPPDDASPEFRKTLRLLLACLSDRSTFTPATINMGDPALHGVKLAEVGRWALMNDYELPEGFPHKPAAIHVSPAPERSPATPAPVVLLVPASDARPDPERRLALLRELGGAAKYARCEWTFTGIKALVTSEKAAGHKRSTEKTVRADLKEAAQNERDAKNAGFATGLGQR